MCVVLNKENMFFTKVKFNVHFGSPAVMLWCATQIPPFRIEALISPLAQSVDCQWLTVESFSEPHL